MKKILLFVIFIFNINYGCFIIEGKGIEGEFGVRSEGLGGAFTAIANDIEGLFYNPAGLIDAKMSALSFGYGKYISNINRAFLGIIYMSSSYTIAGCMNYSYLKLPQTDGFGLPLSSYVAGDYLNGYAGFGTKIIDMISTGITLKYLRKRIGFVTKSFMIGDVGFLIKKIVNIGITFQNIGESLLKRNLNAPPLIFRVGISKYFEWVDFLLSSEYVIEKNNYSYYSLGMELSPFAYLVVRSGINFEDRDVSYHLGGSVEVDYKRIGTSLFINYSISIYSISIDHLFSISLTL